MAALTSSDVTITISERRIVGKKRRNIVKIQFGDGAKTYPSGGVPMPTQDQFGMIRQLDYLNILDQDDSNGVFWKYDKDNNKLRSYVQGVVNGAAGAVTLDDFPVTAGYGTTGSLSMSFNNNAGAGTQRWGALQEVTTSDAPAAQVIYAEAVGW